ncbi:glycosyltransferase [Nocardioides alcanivorans]|uniref:glycosyltransferase n=1 Tax=Nocardioides alcanivorans TaxID=2897352 RepID=UPI001F15A613|nr:glycosyltransferase [Nocardioides alcanivorans]
MTHVVMMMDSPDALGGVQRVLRLLADGLVERGVRTSVVGLVPATVPHRFPTKNELPEFLVHDHDVPLPYSPNTRLRRSRLLARGKAAGVRHFDAGVRRLRGLLADLDDSDDVVVVAHQLRCAEYAVAAGVPKQRLIVEYHDAHSAAEGYHELPRIDRVHRAARVLLTLSDEDTRLFAARGVGPVRTMRNPIDLAALTATAPPQHRDPVVIAAGRHTPQKAYDVLLRAWAQVAPQHPGWRLEIHGDGPDRAALTALVDSLGAPAALLPLSRTYRPGCAGQRCMHSPHDTRAWAW